MASPYYPPRRRWLGDVGRAVACVRRHREPGRAPEAGGAVRQTLLALAVPGQAWVALGRVRLGRTLQITWAILFVVCFVALGQSLANLAFGGMISIHAAGVLRLVFSRFGNSSRSGRVFVGFLLWAALVVCAYFPACNWTANHWLMPLRVGERVLVINRFARCSSVRPGELIAYRIAADQSQPITVAAGFGVDRVLARPGDRVRFTPVDVQVNGVPQPRLPGMPVGAEFVLAEKEWFVWPRLSIYQAYSADPRAVAARVRLGIIDETKYLGRPFQRWFGRRQSIP